MSQNLRRKPRVPKRAGATAMDTTDKPIDMGSPDTDGYPVVFIKWIDAVAYGEWHEPDAEPITCSTVGFLVERTEGAIEVAAVVSAGMVNASIIIPEGMIIEIAQIELKLERSNEPQPPTTIQ